MASGFKQGDVIAYPYLWRWQAERGETEGRKDRPVCVALPLVKFGVTHLFLVAITSTPPHADQLAVPIPETEARRAGLKDRQTGWVRIDECNYDIVEKSFYLDSAAAPLGRFSETFTNKIKAELRQAIEGGRMARVGRVPE